MARHELKVRFFMKNIFPGILILLLCGCAPTTADLLRKNPAGVYSFTVDDDYQVVYQKALDHAKKCYEGAVYGSTIRIRGKADSENGNARISIAHTRLLDVEVLFAIDIARLENNKSNVKVYYALKRLEPVAPLVEDWIKKDSHECQRSRVVLDCVCFLRSSPYVFLPATGVN
jgi:hypothetical protein